MERAGCQGEDFVLLKCEMMQGRGGGWRRVTEITTADTHAQGDFPAMASLKRQIQSNPRFV